MASELERLIGEWSIEASFPGAPPAGEERGSASFEWMQGRKFVVQRWQVPDPAPDGIAVIGAGPDGEGFRQHYFDERGVARLYLMSFEGGTWKLWRDEADFSPLNFRQRFSGELSDDGGRIDGAWERTEADGGWVHDLELIYTRRS